MNEEWSQADQDALDELTERKDRYEAAKRRKIERLVENVFYHGIGFDDVVADMINKADDYIEALSPFTSPKG